MSPAPVTWRLGNPLGSGSKFCYWSVFLLRSVIVLIASCFWWGCSLQQSDVTVVDIGQPESVSLCAEIESRIDMDDRIDTLRGIAQSFYGGCFQTVITYATKAQTEYRHKTFSLHKEASNSFLPDGTWIDYVLESYERGFLTVLLAASYYQLHNMNAARVEVKRLDHELFTPLYNYGADPVNLLFSAVLWESLDEDSEARVDWSRLQGQEGLDEHIRTFASRRLQKMDAGGAVAGEWTIYGVGRFPAVEWDVDFIESTGGYYSVRPQESFLPSCVSESGVMISTASWFDKIAARHSHSYHPLLHFQSWMRLPIGVISGVTTFVTGASIAVGGCAADMYAGGNGSLCRLSLRGGMAMMRQTPKVLRYMLRPDLRHWDNVPSSFIVTTASEVTEEPCFAGLSEHDQAVTTPLFGSNVTNGQNSPSL